VRFVLLRPKLRCVFFMHYSVHVLSPVVAIQRRTTATDRGFLFAHEGTAGAILAVQGGLGSAAEGLVPAARSRRMHRRQEEDQWTLKTKKTC